MLKGGLGGLFEQAQKMREQMQKMQDALGDKRIEAAAGGGMVKVVANGKQQILSVTIEPEVFKMGDREMLQDLVVAGVNQAIKASQEMVSEEMAKLAGGLGPLASFMKGMPNG